MFDKKRFNDFSYALKTELDKNHPNNVILSKDGNRNIIEISDRKLVIYISPDFTTSNILFLPDEREAWNENLIFCDPVDEIIINDDSKKTDYTQDISRILLGDDIDVLTTILRARCVYRGGTLLSTYDDSYTYLRFVVPAVYEILGVHYLEFIMYSKDILLNMCKYKSMIDAREGYKWCNLTLDYTYEWLRIQGKDWTKYDYNSNVADHILYDCGFLFDEEEVAKLKEELANELEDDSEQ